VEWKEFDFDSSLWHTLQGRSKTGMPITILLPPMAMEWFNELKIRSVDSEFVFPKGVPVNALDI